MADTGPAVIKYRGKRGLVYRLKYPDADGKQVWETLGRASDGWTERRARRELRARLTDVDREGRRRVVQTNFAAFATEWLSTYPDAKGLKRSTRAGYQTIVRRHLIPAFGPLRLDAIDVSKVEQYVAAKRRAGYSSRSINRQLNVLGAIFKAALRRQPPLARLNPATLVDRPREPRRRWRILKPEEIARVDRAFTELVQTEESDEGRSWIEQARLVFLTIIGTGLRRSEICGLRWRHVSLADPAGASIRVAETWVRGRSDSPKSEAGERTIALGPVLADELFQHRRRTSFPGEENYVFCHPQKGAPLDPGRYAATFRAALQEAGITDRVRPFHDGRHTSITNAAAAGTAPEALSTRAGHSAYSTTRLYINLAGEAFREDADRLEGRVFAHRRLGQHPS